MTLSLIPPDQRRTLYPDETLENADWPKRTRDVDLQPDEITPWERDQEERRKRNE